MKSPIVSRKTHETTVQTAADNAAAEARTQAARNQQKARRATHATEIRKLTRRAAVLLPPETSGTDPQDLEAARASFRDPIERVEAFAHDRFQSIADKVGRSRKR